MYRKYRKSKYKKILKMMKDLNKELNCIHTLSQEQKAFDNTKNIEHRAEIISNFVSEYKDEHDKKNNINLDFIYDNKHVGVVSDNEKEIFINKNNFKNYIPSQNIEYEKLAQIYAVGDCLIIDKNVYKMSPKMSQMWYSGYNKIHSITYQPHSKTNIFNAYDYMAQLENIDGKIELVKLKKFEVLHGEYNNIKENYWEFNRLITALDDAWNLVEWKDNKDKIKDKLEEIKELLIK